MNRDPGLRSYDEAEAAAFLRTSDRFGAFSNMASGFPLRLGQVEIPSSEALYQALRFPHLPDFQAEILAQRTPILSKRHAYTRVSESRPDWHEINVAVMRFSLKVKFACHPERIRALMEESAGRPIVEISSRDDFWGAFRREGRLVGRNVLGRLLMELRDVVLEHPPEATVQVSAARIPDARLLGSPILDAFIAPAARTQMSLDF
jgi:type I restriction enzyme, S subunit